MYIIAAGALLWGAWYINGKFKKLWWLSLTMAALGSLALTASVVGGWLADIMVAVAGMLAGLVGAFLGGGITATMILGLVALVATVVIIVDIIKDHQCNKYAIGALVVGPLAALSAGGVVGQLHAGLREGGSDAATTAISTLIGG